MINLIKKYYLKYKEIANYLIFGFLTTVICLVIYYALTLTILDPKHSIELQIANVISWIVGVLFAYFTNRKFVFESNSNKKKTEFIKFVSARIFTLLLDMLIMYIFVSKLDYNDKIIKIISQFVVIVSNYLLSKLIVFKKQK